MQITMRELVEILREERQNAQRDLLDRIDTVKVDVPIEVFDFERGYREGVADCRSAIRLALEEAMVFSVTHVVSEVSKKNTG
jgi:hypothetical protein